MYRKIQEIKECEQCENGLAEAAVKSEDAKRFKTEREHPYRTPFIIDRDRIIHSVAFQRMVDKTQLFPSADPSKYTTRLLHSIKVAQIAQTLARAFRLNEDLTEAIALGHDLGHAPFGHIGEDVLRELLIEEGGFEHNEESVLLAMFFQPEMNLSLQTLEGILKHTRVNLQPYISAKVERTNPFEKVHFPGGDQGEYEDPFNYCEEPEKDDGTKIKKLAGYECQVVDVADEIAYICHDVWDLVSAGVINTVDLPAEWLEMFGNSPAIAVNGLVNGIIEENYKEISEEKRGEIKYEIKHPEELDNLVETMKEWFKEYVYEKTETRDARNIIIKLFEYFRECDSESYQKSVYGDLIVNRGFKDKQLAGHLVASLTDKEARNIYDICCE